MSFERPLRGHCACHRNQYFIRAPQDVNEVPQLLFGTSESHRIAQASPLSAHIRVPLTWYHSATISHYPDETATQIRRVYENPLEAHTRRTFCGVCGTPLTYWSERPHSEAAYIQVTIGSLRRDDLGDLEDLGLLPESPVEEERFDIPARGGREEEEEEECAASGTAAMSESPAAASVVHPAGAHRELDIPWFDSIVEGSRLGGRLRTSRGARQSADGSTRVEFEITEYTDEGDVTEAGESPGSGGKRKRDDMESASQL